MSARWSVDPPQPLLAARLAAETNVSEVVVQCLLNRGLSEASEMAAFLEPRLKQLADPFLIPNMAAAVDRLWRAQAQNEPLVILGDYDVDGVTSTALLVEVMQGLGWKVSWYLPRRLEEGYGLTREAAENCLKKTPASLLLAVDCGSTAVQPVEWLRQQGVDVLVLDHHQVSDPPPAAHALVNPQLAAPGDPDFRELCSAGLAFKLAHALVKRGRQLGLTPTLDFDLRPFLELVALGTIADQVPLIRENRILVTAGLERLNRTTRTGLLALKSVAQIRQPIGVYEVGFQLAPRLNAAGRLENAEEALQLLLSRDERQTAALAHQLDAQNRERQQIEQSMVEDVIGSLRARFNPATDLVIVEGRLFWHIGVVGIVASRVLREFHRPTIIVGGEGEQWRGSGRSIEGFDLAAALRSCDNLLIRHGGHALAAGLTLHANQIDPLRIRLNELARHTLTPELLRPLLRLDGEIPLSRLTVGFMSEMRALEPFGPGNPPLHWLLRNLRHQRPPQRLGKEQQHLKMWVTDGGNAVEAVWWNGAEKSWPDAPFDLACAPQINRFNGRESVQLKVLDVRPTDARP